MAHFAILDTNNLVTNVVAVNNLKIEDENGNDVEQKGIDHLKKVFQDENLNAVQCSIWTRNGKRVEVNLHKPAFRNNYPCVGATWDPATENFILPQPYASWILNASQNWIPPVTKPTEEQCYYGTEETIPEIQETDYLTINNILILPDRINAVWNETDTRWQGLHNDGIVRSWDPETLTWSPSL
tara:strand:- start:270 stop:821 length:552 start_codon:yes stop_codon:yes gene_type:complete